MPLLLACIALGAFVAGCWLGRTSRGWQFAEAAESGRLVRIGRRRFGVAEYDE